MLCQGLPGNLHRLPPNSFLGHTASLWDVSGNFNWHSNPWSKPLSTASLETSQSVVAIWVIKQVCLCLPLQLRQLTGSSACNCALWWGETGKVVRVSIAALFSIFASVGVPCGLGRSRLSWEWEPLFLLFFSCPSSSRPTLVTHSLTRRGNSGNLFFWGAGLGTSHPTHPHLGKFSQMKLFFWDQP